MRPALQLPTSGWRQRLDALTNKTVAKLRSHLVSLASSVHILASQDWLFAVRRFLFRLNQCSLLSCMSTPAAPKHMVILPLRRLQRCASRDLPAKRNTMYSRQIVPQRSDAYITHHSKPPILSVQLRAKVGRVRLECAKKKKASTTIQRYLYGNQFLMAQVGPCWPQPVTQSRHKPLPRHCIKCDSCSQLTSTAPLFS